MEKSLLEQLHKLKNCQPDRGWKEVNRAVLLNKVLADSQDKNIFESGWLLAYHKFIRAISQPAFVVAAVILVVVGMFSFMETKNMIPGDSLYIARVISEKAQLAIVFDQNKKDILTIKFASSHAKDITKALADPRFNHEDLAQKEKLATDFKKEINSVKEKLANLNIVEEPKVTTEATLEEDGLVYSAEFKKDEQGIELAGGESAGEEQVEVAEVAPMAEEKTGINEAHRILDEVEVLFLADNYEEVLNKLNEVDSLISGDGEVENGGGEVQENEPAEDSTATTTAN